MNLNPIARELLSVAKDLGELSYKIITTPKGKLTVSNISKTNYYYHVKNLEKNKLLTSSKNNRGSSRLTLKGFKELGKHHQELRIDQKLTMIMFDIPISKNRERIVLRRFLIKHKFKQMQKSVLISEYAISKFIKDKIEDLGLLQYVNILSVNFES